MSWAEIRKTLKLPIRIADCPIVEAVVAFQIEAKVPSDAVFGVVFAAVRESFKAQLEPLPVLQLPEVIRNRDPDLANQPHYRLKQGNNLIQIGPKVIAFINLRPYSGWREFSSFVRSRCEEIERANLVEHVRRVGVRYINFIEGDVWEQVRLGHVIDHQPVPATRRSLEWELETNGFTTVIRIANRAQLNLPEGALHGSLLDVDCFVLGQMALREAFETAERAHTEEKRTFFALLTEDCLNRFNPTYE